MATIVNGVLQGPVSNIFIIRRGKNSNIPQPVFIRVTGDRLAQPQPGNSTKRRINGPSAQKTWAHDRNLRGKDWCRLSPILFLTPFWVHCLKDVSYSALIPHCLVRYIYELIERILWLVHLCSYPTTWGV